MTPEWCSKVGPGVRLVVQVAPNARKNEVVGIVADAVKIRLQAQPIEGKANEALIRFLATRLGVPATAIQITHGHTGRRKLLRIDAPGMELEQVKLALLGNG